jgi:hypothetical protein
VVPVVELVLRRLRLRQFVRLRRLRFNRFNAEPAVVRIQPALEHVEDSRTMGKPIARGSRTVRRIVQDSRTTGKPIVQDNRMHRTIVVQRHVQVSRMAPRIAQANRMGQKIVRVNRTTHKTTVQDSPTAPRIVRVNRTVRRIVQDSRTITRAPALRRTATYRALAVPTMLVRIMADRIATHLAVIMRMLLGPALLIIALLLRKLATRRGTMVVPRHRRIATYQRPTITTFPGLHLPLRRSSSRASIRAHGQRTIVRKNNHRHGPRITVPRKLRR